VQSTDSVINVRAWVAAAGILLVCAFGCQEVETRGPSDVLVAADRPRNSWIVAADACSARTVEVCRLSWEEAGTSPSTSATLAGEITLADCRFNEDASDTMGLRVPPHETPVVSADITQDLGGVRFASFDEIAPLPPSFGDAGKGLKELATEPAETCAECGQASASSEASDDSPKARFGKILATTRDNVFHDYGNYYSRDTLLEVVVILAPAGAFANSDWDAEVGDWYQRHVRSNETNHAATVFRTLGNGYYMIPAYVSAKFLGEYFDDRPGMAMLGEFGDRTTRALLVGAPSLLAVQYLTGGGRPSDIQDQSYWKPFHNSKGASGHAFMGAVPFLVLAGMTDDPLAKCLFYACSPWSGISRINDNVHYLSQVWLGWWMAYLACDAVKKTEKEKGPITITPFCTPEMTGVGLIYQH
jgi:hypothetical protein